MLTVEYTQALRGGRWRTLSLLAVAILIFALVFSLGGLKSVCSDTLFLQRTKDKVGQSLVVTGLQGRYDE